MLIEKLRTADMNQTRILLHENPDLIQLDGFPAASGWKDSPLCHLVYFRENPEQRVSAVEYLISRGADINYINSKVRIFIYAFTKECLTNSNFYFRVTQCCKSRSQRITGHLSSPFYDC